MIKMYWKSTSWAEKLVDKCQERRQTCCQDSQFMGGKSQSSWEMTFFFHNLHYSPERRRRRQRERKGRLCVRGWEMKRSCGSNQDAACSWCCKQMKPGSQSCCISHLLIAAAGWRQRAVGTPHCFCSAYSSVLLISWLLQTQRVAFTWHKWHKYTTMCSGNKRSRQVVVLVWACCFVCIISLSCILKVEISKVCKMENEMYLPILPQQLEIINTHKANYSSIEAYQSVHFWQ